jgi:hypothetical protein
MISLDDASARTNDMVGFGRILNAMQPFVILNLGEGDSGDLWAFICTIPIVNFVLKNMAMP